MTLRHITFVRSFGRYNPGDGLQLTESEATTLVDSGFAVFSESYRV